MFSGLFYKTLKGSNGWSSLQLNRIDVECIKKVYYKKRLFRIFDFDKPYKLVIEYYHPQDTFNVNPIIGGNGGFVLNNSVELDHLITKRYKTEKEVKAEIDEIEEYQKQIESIKEIYKQEMLEKVNKKKD